MPIEKSKWNEGKLVYPLKEKILLFLSRNPDEAFTLKEIVKGIGYSIQVVLQGYGDAPESQFRSTLDELMEEGLVEIRTTQNKKEPYYIATKKAISTMSIT